MSKRILIPLLLVLLAAGVLVFVYFDRIQPFLPFGDPVFTDEIPEKRPRRLDHRQMVQAEGLGMPEILSTLAPGDASRGPDPADPETARLLASLPDEPLPFGEDSVPRDADWLREFATGLEAGAAPDSAPAAGDLWRFNLALSALKVRPEQLPEALRRHSIPSPESDTFAIRLEPLSADLEGPFTVGNFDAQPDLEILHRGGTAIARFAPSGELASLDGSPLAFPGDALHPGDYDGDGDLDLYVVRGGGVPDSLMRNDGEGHFDDVTIEAGLLAFRDTSAACWADYDRDGLLDLLVGSADQPLELYRQDANGAFQAVAWDLGLWVPRGIRSIAAEDVSGDGLPDLYLGIAGKPDRFCLARPSTDWRGWRFEEVTDESGLAGLGDAAPAWIDFDNDGRADLLACPAGSDSGGRLRLFRNEDGSRFLEVTAETGLDSVEDAVSACAFDLDNDGFADLLVGTPELAMNRVFWNRGGVAFREVSVASRGSYLDHPTEPAGIDLDRDGVEEILYRRRSGGVRRLEPAGPLAPALRLRVEGHRPGSILTCTIRDSDWILHTVRRRLDRFETVSIGLGEGETIESLALYAPGESEPLATMSQVPAGEPVTLVVRSRTTEDGDQKSEDRGQ